MQSVFLVFVDESIETLFAIIRAYQPQEIRSFFPALEEKSKLRLSQVDVCSRPPACVIVVRRANIPYQTNIPH